MQFLTDNWLELLATLVGIVYIILEYRASIALWLVGIIMPAIDIYLFWSVGLYADFAMAIYYTVAALYGYAVWKFGRKRGQKEGEEMPVSHIKKKHLLPCFVVFIASWYAIYYILVSFTNSDVPVTDSFINALSIIGLWALARKYVEHWLIWIVVEVASCALYTYKGIPFKGALYGLYFFIAIMGYFKWKKMIKS